MSTRRPTGLLINGLVLALVVAAPAAADTTCNSLCQTPPGGCKVEGALQSGPCDLQTCGSLCGGESKCPIPCSAAPGVTCAANQAVSQTLGQHVFYVPGTASGAGVCLTSNQNRLLTVPGRRYGLEVTGTIGSGVVASGDNGPFGWAATTGLAGDDFPLPGARKFGLIYRLGTGRWTAFDNQSFRASGIERFCFKVNDNRTDDNNGRFNVTVTESSYSCKPAVPPPAQACPASQRLCFGRCVPTSCNGGSNDPANCCCPSGHIACPACDPSSGICVPTCLVSSNNSCPPCQCGAGSGGIGVGSTCLGRGAACQRSAQCCNKVCTPTDGGAGRCGPPDPPKPPSNAPVLGTFSCSGTISINGEDCEKELGTATQCLKANGGIWCPAIREGCTCKCSLGDCPNAAPPHNALVLNSPPADIKMELLSFAPPTFKSAETTIVNFRLTNIGGKPSSCVMNVHGSVDGLRTYRAGRWDFTGVLKPGEHVDASLSTMPNSWGAGAHTFAVAFSESGCVSDSNPANNSASLQFSITP